MGSASERQKNHDLDPWSRGVRPPWDKTDFEKGAAFLTVIKYVYFTIMFLLITL